KQTLLLPVAMLSRENTSNLSESPFTGEWVYTIIPPYILTLCLLGLLFNSFVLGVYLTHKDILTVAEIYLCNLALADFILLNCLPFWGMYILNNFNWLYGDVLREMVNSIIIIYFYTSSFPMAMISVDRYLALVKTMKALWLRRKLYAKVNCLILWFIENFKKLSSVLDYNHHSNWKLAHQIVMNVVGFVVPFLVIVFSSWNIIKALATVLVYAVTLLFLLCWCPLQVIIFLHTLSDVEVLDIKLWKETLDAGTHVTVYLGFLNSAMNPLLYVLSVQHFWNKVFLLLPTRVINHVTTLFNIGNQFCT
uniref:G-protein coupled receptors family 1 profile domain-containing protein n=1 Tax=Mola mola TaxID=94237 RepID=A0A3Q3WKZ9_MOLML